MFELVNPTTSATGSVTVEVFDANSNGTAGFGLSSINTNRYWTATPSTAFIKTTSIRLTEGTLSGANRIGQSTTVSGSYSSRGGGSVSPVLSGNVGTMLGAFVLGGANINLSAGTYTVGTSGQLIKLTDVAAILNNSTLTGHVIFEMQSDYDGTTGEVFPIMFKQFGTSGGNWTATIRPAAGSPAITTSGDQVTTGATIGLISFDSSATNIIFDGRAGGTGSSIGWTFRNTRTAGVVGATFRFINGANNISLNYLQIEGQNTTTSSGTILFTTATGGITGNSFNTISNCIIRDRSDGLGTATPANCIYSVGTVGKVNSDNNISNNSIFNFTSAGVYVSGSTNGDNWVVTGNSLYSTLAPTTSQTGIYLSPGTTAGNYTVSNNYIGGKDVMAGGNAWANSNNGSFIGIYLSLSGIAASSVQGNVIQNIQLSGTSGSNFTGIHVENGKVNIGTVTGNTIGSGTEANSIRVFGTSVTRGIYSSPASATDKVEIANNTIANMTSSNNGAGVYITGIYADAGINNIHDNTISNLTTNSSNTGVTNTASVTGIVDIASGTSQNIINNHIHSLSNTFLVASVSVIGIYFGTSSTSQPYNVSRNFIHNFSTSSQVMTSQQIGIHAASNSKALVSNNMVSLGYNAAGTPETLSHTLIGLNKTGSGSYNIYHNSLYIGGTGVGTDTTRTYAFRKIAAGADTVLNNIFVNERSNATTGGKHYAISLTNKTGLVQNNNVFHTNGNGTIFGFDAVTDRADLAAWNTANPFFDLTSFTANPNFIMPSGNAATTDLHIKPSIGNKIESGALIIPGFIDDYDAAGSRAAYPLLDQTNGGGTAPDIGADEGDIIPTDFSAPEITYSPIISSCNVTDRSLVATISKTNGQPFPTTGSFVPRIYYKKGNNSYFSKPGTLVTGNGFFSTWNFTIVNADMGGVVNGDSIYYYIIAQDSSNTPDISSEPAGVVASTVNNIVTPPTAYVYAVGSIPTPTITQTGDTLASSTGATYQWYRDNNIINGATSQTYIATLSGSYTVLVGDGSGCSATSSPFDLIFTDIQYSTDIHSVLLYPNPATDGLVNLVVPTSMIDSEYQIYSVNGNLIKKGIIENTKSEIHISHLSSGIYLSNC
ncbi:MAG: T9SS type A sorting domain-containing protein [Bacteroidetes bacterium]|nr:T9SS type A sorting domain-containing protein [Bacteroidota bacterium]